MNKKERYLDMHAKHVGYPNFSTKSLDEIWDVAQKEAQKELKREIDYYKNKCKDLDDFKFS